MTEEKPGQCIQCPHCQSKIPRPAQAMTWTCVNCGKTVPLDDRFFGTRYVFGGEVLTRGRILVGPQGSVKANLSGTDVTIEGSVEGNVKAVEMLILGKTAKLHGDASAARLVVAEGASLKGRLEIGQPGT